MQEVPGAARRSLAKLAAPWLLPLLLACSETSPDEPKRVCDTDTPAPSSAPAVEVLQTVDGKLVPIASGDYLPTIHGQQGGTHVWVHVRYFLDGDETIISTEATLTDDDSGLEVAYGFETLKTCTGTWTQTRRITVFYSQPHGETGMLHVKADAPASAPLSLDLPVSLNEPLVPPPPNP